MMTARSDAAPNVGTVDAELRVLVRLAAAIAGGSEEVMRACIAAATAVRTAWVEEVILQSYLFAGFPRALNAAREWRRSSGAVAPPSDAGVEYDRASAWRDDGERTCAAVYGEFYQPLRRNIRDLHPALDAWMVVEGYGKVLSRPALDLPRRELCIVAACAAAGQDRQLHAHMHGALNTGSRVEDIADTLDALVGIVSEVDRRRHHHLLTRVTGHHVR